MDAFVRKQKRKTLDVTKVEKSERTIPIKIQKTDSNLGEGEGTQISSEKCNRPTPNNDITEMKAVEKPGGNTEKELKDTKTLELGPELSWKKLSGEHLDCEYCRLYTTSEAGILFQRLESELVYNTGRMAQVHIYGKWLDIPRKQTAHGDAGLKYRFSGTTVPSNPWTQLLLEIKDKVETASGHSFNFVLINRYKDGDDHIGEHRDDEKDLEKFSPIASLSLGQARDFIFKHGDARGKKRTRNIDTVQVCLESGTLLLMNYPTNVYWYHSVPVRKKLHEPRINLTFRKMVT